MQSSYNITYYNRHILLLQSALDVIIYLKKCCKYYSCLYVSVISLEILYDYTYYCHKYNTNVITPNNKLITKMESKYDKIKDQFTEFVFGHAYLHVIRRMINENAGIFMTSSSSRNDLEISLSHRAGESDNASISNKNSTHPTLQPTRSRVIDKSYSNGTIDERILKKEKSSGSIGSDSPSKGSMASFISQSQSDAGNEMLDTNYDRDEKKIDNEESSFDLHAPENSLRAESIM
jgi:hypothetical protein